MEKVSRYLVVSESAYRAENGVRVRLAYATRRARLVVVDAPTGRALAAGDLDRISPAWLPVLREALAVVPADADERDLTLARNRKANSEPSRVHLSLLPTAYCNMGCSYCGQAHSRGGLGSNHRDQVRARVLRAITAADTRIARVDWFGAEPMIGYAVIRDLAPTFVAAAAERDVTYQSCLVTNGSLLTAEKLDELIRRCGVTHVEVTVDGPPEVHDTHRPLKNGGSSFWKIVGTLREAVSEPAYRGTEFRFRTNVDRANQESISRYIDLMARQGFQKPNVSFSIVPVHSWGNDVSNIEVSRRDFARTEIGWLRQLRANGLRFQVLPRIPSTVLCPATTRFSEIISSTGNIFSCSEYPLVPAAERTLTLTHLSRAGEEVGRPVGPFDDWHDDIATGKSWCTDCVLMPTCGGSCPKAWREGHPPCPSYKYNIQERLDLIAEEYGLTVEPLVGAE
ncbi:radical SAM protein [Micromonospora rifamycinica]|uniref:radical SAM/SPASM domain-containing protein n=1 Tax=Micromonospora rifamycinica TaxID=291594 RepID=UPI002E2C8B4A|nr:radical SAM protein [Micromonospora rifamycinica]